jgi:hypothetical protein
MEFTYQNKKHISRILLLMVILLLSFNFKIYTRADNEGNLNETIVNQSKEFKYNILSNDDNKEKVKVAVQIKQLLDAVFTGISIDSVTLLFTPFILIYRSKFFFERKDTLVSLCVRMDN